MNEPLTKEQLIQLLHRCESAVTEGRDTVEIRVEDLANLCERVRTLMQMEAGLQFLLKKGSK